MELKLYNGDYQPDGTGGFSTVDGADEVLQRVLLKLQARRGAFPLMPDYGSRLYLLYKTRASDRESAAKLYITEAVSDEPDISLRDVAVFDAEDNAVGLEIVFDYRGSTVSTSVIV